MKLRELFTAVTIAVTLLFAGASAATQPTPRFIETTSDVLLSNSGPGTGVTIALYYQSGSKAAALQEQLFTDAMRSHPDWQKTCRLYKVDIDADTDHSSLPAAHPTLVMTVTGADGRLRVLNATSTALPNSRRTDAFIATGIERFKHPPNTGPLRVRQATADQVDAIVDKAPNHQALVLYYDHRGYLSMAMKNVFERVSAGPVGSQFVFITVDQAVEDLPSEWAPSMVLHIELDFGGGNRIPVQSEPFFGFIGQDLLEGAFK